MLSRSQVAPGLRARTASSSLPACSRGPAAICKKAALGARSRPSRPTGRFSCVSCKWAHASLVLNERFLNKKQESVLCKLNDDDDELLVRASAVLKSQGPENWSRGRPGDRSNYFSRSAKKTLNFLPCFLAFLLPFFCGAKQAQKKKKIPAARSVQRARGTRRHVAPTAVRYIHQHGDRKPHD